jgi:hypothetical protein
MKNQFQILQPWLAQILHILKRELKSEHLSKNLSFCRTHFGGRPTSRVSNDEVIAAYEKELLQGNEDLGDWIVNRWVFHHGEIYRHFAETLSRIHPDFDEIKTLDEPQSASILSGAVESFGALPTYIFSVLNGVVFPETVLKRLRETAEKEELSQKKKQAATEATLSLEQIIARHQREVARLQDKIAGVMKKYTTDVDALKKQIRALQQRLNAQP